MQSLPVLFLIIISHHAIVRIMFVRRVIDYSRFFLRPQFCVRSTLKPKNLKTLKTKKPENQKQLECVAQPSRMAARPLN